LGHSLHSGIFFKRKISTAYKKIVVLALKECDLIARINLYNWFLWSHNLRDGKAPTAATAETNI
jgi:hypothetical protein